MIDVWVTEAWKVKSSKAKNSRSRLPYNHTSGSRSFAATMSILRAKNHGQAPVFSTFYKDTHYNKKTGNWVNETAMDIHERLVNKSIEQSQPEITSSMTVLEISVDVLGRRTNYLKGYGIRYKGSSSTRTFIESAERDAEVLALKEKVAAQSEQMAAQAQQMVAQVRKQADLEALMKQFLERGLPSASGGGDFS